MDSILITGGSGFIGQNLILHATANGFNVKLWKRNDPISIENCKFVVHLAAYVHQMNNASSDILSKYRKINRDLTLDIARSSIKCGVKKFIFISTVKVMGNTGKKKVSKQREKKNGPANKECLREIQGYSNIFTEKDICEPDDPYGISKLEAEQGLTDLFSGQSDAQCIILRLPMVYGAGNKGNVLALLKAASKKIVLPLGDAKGKRSMIYVNNVCDAICKLLQDQKHNRPNVQTYFVNDGKDITSAELYTAIFEAFNKGKGVFFVPQYLLRAGGKIGSYVEKLFERKLPLNQEVVTRLLDEYRFSSNAFSKDYNWEPLYNPEQGIIETVKWYKEQNKGEFKSLEITSDAST